MSKIVNQKWKNYSHSLVKLALTPDEVRCFQLLVAEGSLNAKSLGKGIGVLPNAVYRLITNLKQKGFIVELDTHPISFQALPPDIAINAYAQNKLKEINQLITLSLKEVSARPSSSTNTIEQITGRNAMFLKSAEMINKSKNEVLIISIGESVPDEIKIANRDAIERGVTIKFIAQIYNQRNAMILKSWVRMGLEVRHLSETGYHMQIVDGNVCLLSTSNPENSAERSSMIIRSVGLSNAIRNYFYMLWEKALPIKIE